MNYSYAVYESRTNGRFWMIILGNELEISSDFELVALDHTGTRNYEGTSKLEVLSTLNYHHVKTAQFSVFFK